MRVRFLSILLFLALGATVTVMPQPGSAPAKLMIVDPGHFHASLIQREMYPVLARHVSVYAPLGPELLDYLNRVSVFNRRAENPTQWNLDVHTSADPMSAMLREHPGNAVVFTGKNRSKIDRIVASLDAGLHVFADKPWIISSSDMGKLERALETADRKGLAAYDIMTERFEVTSELQRAFVGSPEVFGRLESVDAKSIHHVMKIVAGVPLRRPTWFFDTVEYGEGLADVGTHVVDLVQWTAFPDQVIDYRKDLQVLDGKHWPLTITKMQFQQVTGEPDFPAALSSHVHDGKFDYYCNDSVHYTLRGADVKLEILWNWEAAPGAGDVYEASFRGTNARVEIRQGQAEKFIPEVYLVPANAKAHDAIRAKVDSLQTRWPGLAIREVGTEIRLVIPEKFRVGHEAHFAQVANKFFEYLQSPKSIPAWERPNMLAKYYVSTKGVELGNKKPRD